VPSSTSSTSGRRTRRSSSSSSSGPTGDLLHFRADYPVSWRALLELSVRHFLFLPLFTNVVEDKFSEVRQESFKYHSFE
jgi:hypothetical protein